MKFKLFVVLGLCATLFTQYGCSNEVEVIGVWQDIPVVYAVINQQDSVNYIRVERAYLPPNQSALDVARIPDSLYFDTMDVDVTLWTLINNDTVPWPNPLVRVDLANENITRDLGIFAEQPAYAYKMVGTGSGDLFLKIENHKTGNTFWAATETVVGSSTNLFTTPSYSFTPYKPIAWREVNPQGDEVYTQITVEMTANGFASIYDYKFRFHYKEYEIDNFGNQIAGTVVPKTMDWRAASDFIPQAANQTKRVISGEAFYQFLGQNLSDVTGTNLRRCAGYLEVFVEGASAPLRDYVLARQANAGFVGGLYPSEPYSNIQGGYGVFATADKLERVDRLSDPRLMQMSALTYQHLREGDFTKDKGFESNNPCY